MSSHVPCTNCAANFFLTLCLRSQLPFLGVKEHGPQGTSRYHFPTQGSELDTIPSHSGLRPRQPSPTQGSELDNTPHYAQGLERRSHKEAHVPE